MLTWLTRVSNKIRPINISISSGSGITFQNFKLVNPKPSPGFKKSSNSPHLSSKLCWTIPLQWPPSGCCWSKLEPKIFTNPSNLIHSIPLQILFHNSSEVFTVLFPENSNSTPLIPGDLPLPPIMNPRTWIHP